MIVWNEARKGYEAVSGEEMKRLFLKKEGAAFDASYNAHTFQEFYQPDERFSELFWNAAGRLSSLHRYLEYSRRYIEGYLAEGEACGKTFAPGQPHTGEDEVVYDETFLADRSYFPAYNYESIFLMLYTFYETFLAQLAAEVGAVTGKRYEKSRYQGALVDRYLAFLCKTCGFCLAVPREKREVLDGIRKIRNAFVHNGGEATERTKEIAKRFSLVIGREGIVLSYDFLILCLETVGAMLSALEEGYWEVLEGLAQNG